MIKTILWSDGALIWRLSGFATITASSRKPA